MNYRFSLMKFNAAIVVLLMFVSLISIAPAYGQATPGTPTIETCKKNSKILTPANKGSGEGFPLTLTGTAAGCPETYHFWIVVHPIGATGYWPQAGEILPNPRDNSWEAQAWIGDGKGPNAKGINQKFELILVIADDGAHNNFRQYLDDGPKKGYPAVPLPKGAIKIDQITYTRTQ